MCEAFTFLKWKKDRFKASGSLILPELNDATAKGDLVLKKLSIQ